MIPKEKLAAALSELFAPWVQALRLRVEAVDESSITLRLPQSDELSRVGGMLCGQAMMAAADTAMVLALMNHFGEFKPCTTVQMSSSFLKPLANADGWMTARLSRVGKSMAFGEITLRDDADGAVVFTATTVYALLNV
jgi:acyl-coenzyme A thioesterase PaaI-like protein